MLKTLILAFILTHGNSEPILSWEDFKGHVPENELTVAARTQTSLTFESLDSAGLFTCHVSAQFLSSESWVRIKSDANLRHETVHYQIALLEAALCNKALSKYQNKPLPSMKPIVKIYEHYQREIDLLNEQFDRDSAHGNNATVEAIYEKRILIDLNKLK